MSFTHLHVHNEYSLLDGLGTAKQYVERAKELGQTALALTNHGNVDGNIRFQNACKDAGIIPIHGCEAYIVKDYKVKEKGEKRSHILLLAKNEKGWQNLLKMLTIACMDGFYYRPRISPELLLENCEGLVVSTACVSSFLLESWGIDFLLKLKEKTDVFVEIMPLRLDEQRRINELCIRANRSFEIPIIATNDCHYVLAEDHKAQEVLLAMQSKKKWTDPTRWRFTVNDLFLKSKKEMVKSFRDLEYLDANVYREAIDNTEMIVDLCKDFKINKISVDLPDVPKLSGDDETELRRLCKKGFKKKVLDVPERSKKEKVYRKRMDEELDAIVKQGFSRYFLIVWELINWCRSQDIMVGPGRGSSGGSLVCYLLNITQVDPIKHKLIFARFISPARIDLPDIDMDFEDIKRGEIRKHLEDLYGEKNVSGVSTFSTMKGRGALRDVARVFDVPLVDVNKASKSIVVRSGGDFRSSFTIEDAFNTFEDGIAFKEKYPQVTKIAIRLEGLVKGKGQHAAAIVITKDNLRKGKRAYLIPGKDGNLNVNWDKKDIEHIGLMKLDVLGLNELTVLNAARKIVKERQKKDIIYEELPMDDEEVYKQFSLGNNIGCFQLRSLGLRRYCQQLGIDDFDMLVHATALYRPGTLRSGMATEFIKRKKGEEEWSCVHPIVEELTKDTFGIILYQEQVMLFMYELGGLGWKTADTIRKVISKSQGVEQFEKFRKEFADGCVKRKTLDRETAEELWSELSSFGSYGFNLSHAVEYSYITYWDMWMKVHYPIEFICAKLTYGNEKNMEEIVEEAIRLGLDIRPPKIGMSKAFDWVVKGNILYCPFVEIKGLGDKTAGYAEQYNEKGFFTGEGKSKLGQKFLNILKDIGAFENRVFDDDEYERISKYFKFSFCRDKMRKYKKVLDKIKPYLDYRPIDGIDFNEIDKDYYHYIGLMTEVKFGYRSAIQKLDSSKKNDGSNLGGVYGNLDDGTSFCMMIYNSKIYGEKKNAIEHSSGEYLIAECNIPTRAGSIQCNNVWFMDEIKKGELSGLDLKLAEKGKRFINEDVLACEGCDLRKECKSPVLPSKGKYNIMIIGEAPGRDEDRAGMGFVGKSGDALWEIIEKGGFSRRDFHVTNVCKCWPSKSRTPNRRQIKKCSVWLDEELKEIKPYVVLALGNTNIKYFTDQDSGIMGRVMENPTEWNDKYNCWICWSIHPASTLYSPENKTLFKKGIKNFTNKVKILGGL